MFGTTSLSVSYSHYYRHRNSLDLNFDEEFPHFGQADVSIIEEFESDRLKMFIPPPYKQKRCLSEMLDECLNGVDGAATSSTRMSTIDINYGNR